uniref:Uncharacterized protein n=1 Tax=Anguilla anguilla TaxID=7936 RepID=A0A0E9PRU4_ANGAN
MALLHTVAPAFVQLFCTNCMIYCHICSYVRIPFMKIYPLFK